MNKKIIFPALAATLSVGLLASCSSGAKDLGKFKEEFAIKELRAENYTYTKESLDSDIEFLGDYYYQDGGYKSIYTDNEITCKKGELEKVYKHGYNLYKLKNHFYDSFGYQISDLYADDYATTQVKYLICAENSPLYRGFSGLQKEDVKDSRKLKVLEVLTFLDEYDNEICGICKEYGDTHFKAKNTIDENGFYRIGHSMFIDDVNSIEYLNDNELRVKKGSTYSRVKYHEEEQEISGLNLNIEITQEHDNSSFDDEKEKFIDIVDISFAGTMDHYKYSVKPVGQISNDFDFVYEGKKYDAKVTIGNEINDKPDYALYPKYYLMNKDNEYAFALGKIIGSDGNLSNSNYSFMIDNKISVGKPIKDVSIFTDDGGYMFNGHYTELEEDETLLILNDDYKMIKDDMGCKITYKDGSVKSILNKDINIESSVAINGEYVVKAKADYGHDKYNYYILKPSTGYTRNLGAVDFINYSKGIYATDNEVYIGSTSLGSFSKDYNYKNYSYTSFAEAYDIAVVELNSSYEYYNEKILVKFNEPVEVTK